MNDSRTTTATTATTGALTYESLVDSMKKLNRELEHSWKPTIRENPLFHLGLRLIEVEPRYVPKLKLSAAVPLPDDFRREFDQWLLDMFGQVDVTTCKRGQMFVFGDSLMIRRDDLAVIRAQLVV